MSELNYLQFQPIDPTTDDISDDHRFEDEIDINEQLDDDTLEGFWDQVVQDIHQDASWSFSEE